jgi:hypothetical protein
MRPALTSERTTTMHFSTIDVANAIIHKLDELPAGIDPDFDLGREELEFEFAALRLTLESNQRRGS